MSSAERSKDEIVPGGSSRACRPDVCCGSLGSLSLAVYSRFAPIPDYRPTGGMGHKQTAMILFSPCHTPKRRMGPQLPMAILATAPNAQGIKIPSESPTSYREHGARR
jgi:hypothetical protein